MSITTQNILNFQNHILSRYANNARSFPRRKSSNGYHILIAETMSQQTQVSRVIPKYQKFIKTLPTIHDLANTNKHTVLSLRSGLGYNNRAIRLQKSAQIICQSHHGEIPDDEKILLTLPGI